MDAHVVDLVQDVLFGHVDRETACRVHAHLAVCDECAADYTFAFRLRDASMAAPLDASLAQFLETLEMPAASSAQAPVRRLRRLSVRPTRIAVSFLAAAAALLLLVRPWSDDEFASIARLEPLPVRLTREAPEPESFAEARLQALSAYRDGDWTTALARCETALQRRPGDGEMTVYAASAEAFLQRLPAAAERLDALLADAAQPIAILREARWQRAQLALHEGDDDRARVELEFLVRESGIRQEDARAQLQQL
jgi:hypothetical protein